MILADWLVLLAAILFVVALVVGIRDAYQYAKWTHEDPTAVAIDAWETEA